MQTKVEKEIKKRIKLCVWAYTYEMLDAPVASDAEFDKLVREIDLSVKTGNEEMDEYFKNNFIIDSGRWIHKHPDHEGLARLVKYYER